MKNNTSAYKMLRTLLINIFALNFVCSLCYADEGGLSFWVPGFFGSLAAAPLQSGPSFTTLYYHSTLHAGKDIAFARQVTLGNIKSKLTSNVNLNLDAEANLLFAIPSYTFKKKLLDGQASVVLAIPYGRSKASANATVVGNLGFGSGFSLGSSKTDAVTNIGDVVPMFNIRWNKNSNNYLAYLAGNLPVGSYDAKRLANLGTNHNSIDSGLGYTYFDYATGNEFSSVAGITYNFENGRTQYQNGVDMHVDLSASKFFNKKKQLGLVGYAYQQLSCDQGADNFVGCFKSRVFGIGPQAGYLTQKGKTQIFMNVKGYQEFAAINRAHGWNLWLTLSLSPALSA